MHQGWTSRAPRAGHCLSRAGLGVREVLGGKAATNTKTKAFCRVLLRDVLIIINYTSSWEEKHLAKFLVPVWEEAAPAALHLPELSPRARNTAISSTELTELLHSHTATQSPAEPGAFRALPIVITYPQFLRASDVPADKCKSPKSKCFGLGEK